MSDMVDVVDVPEFAGDAKPHDPCGTCGACCRSYIVPVCGYDVWLISKHQRIGPEQFLIACPQEEAGFDGFRLSMDRPAYGLALDKQGPIHPNRPCVFLMHFGEGNTRCGVYGHRPSVCRAYPMSIWNLQVHQMPESLCPPKAWPEGEAKRPSWRAAMERLYMHFDIYNEVVSRWNARVGRMPPGIRFTLNEYFSYLLNVYDRLDSLAKQVGEEEVERIQRSWPTAPRPNIDLDEMRVRSGERPWLDYLLRVRGVIDGFFLEVEPQPLLAFMPTYTPSTASKLPLDALKPAKAQSKE